MWYQLRKEGKEGVRGEQSRVRAPTPLYKPDSLQKQSDGERAGMTTLDDCSELESRPEQILE